ncbi:adenylate kinase [Spironucleus salmonicida]|uniref:Adenylate kinase isoenzyme 6 homolog n=1 Tax=Spironucleus salmonicida TaxID=348837 RepID=V6LMZ7_9EUKA|nr:adenylate kinase [Spironucleus salmonicida]|eukprot:EST45081.1 Shikimate kinase domain-containing protein [Spironucleus salmonicida]
MHLLITGSVGTGKTSLSNILGAKLNIEVIHISDLIIDQKLYKQYDELFDSYIPDEDRIIQYFKEKIISKHKDFIIDHHSFDIFSNKFLDLTIVLHSDLKVLKQRLSLRQYSEKKIDENLQCEIMDVVADEAYRRFKNILELTNDTNEDQAKNIDIIIMALNKLKSAQKEGYEEEWETDEE